MFPSTASAPAVMLIAGIVVATIAVDKTAARILLLTPFLFRLIFDLHLLFKNSS